MTTSLERRPLLPGDELPNGAILITDQDRRLLGELCTRSDSGKHFTEAFPAQWLDRMERAGVITISRPTHWPTGITYSQEYWSVGIMPSIPGVTDDQGYLIED